MPCVASKTRRLANYILDIIIFRLLLIPTWYLIGYFTARFGVLDADTVLSLTDPIVDWSLSIVSFFFYYFAFEAIWQRTPAKFITGTKVLHLYGTKPTARTIALRTLARLVPFEPFSFLGKEARGWHDTWSQTFVARSKKLEAGIQHSTTRVGEQNDIAMGTSREETIRRRILRRDRQATWVALALLAVFFIAIIIVHFSNTPASTWANKIDYASLLQKRDLSTPSSRLVGHWVGVPNGGTLYYRPIDHFMGYGTFTWSIQSDVSGKLKVLSESRSGKYLKTREFIILEGESDYAIAEYCIPKDGQSMTKEIILENGNRALFEYRYVDGMTHP